MRGVAERLLREAPASLVPLGGGRNGRVWRVTAGGQSYALKEYFRHAADTRDRLASEYEGLRFLWRNGVRGVPEPLCADREAGCALYALVEGRKIPGPAISAADIEAAVSFLSELKDLAGLAESKALPVAAEACFSADALAANLQARLDRLLAHQEDEGGNPAFRAFMAEEFLPAFRRVLAWSLDRLAGHGELPQAERTLSPSDFGFHNALCRADGQWVFLDFEYFGWDDPAKMAADFLLHPGMELAEERKRQFASGLLRRFADHRTMAERLPYLYPLYGLKWCLILLNEFLPEHLLRRRFAAPPGGDRQALEREQLAKARRMLRRVCSEYECFPYRP